MTAKSKESQIIKLAAKFKSAIGLIGLIIVMSFLSEYFLTVHNLMNVTRQVSINAVLALGMTFVILTGGIDLSVGSVLALSSVITAGLMSSGMNIALVLIIGIGVGTLLGLLNGILVAKGKMQPFIVTLGMMTIARGLTLIYSNGRPISGFDKAFRFLGAGHLLGIPVPVIIMFALLAVSYVVLKKTPFGRYVYAIGGNEKATELSGINTDKIKIGVYAISGFLASISGIILASRLNSAQPTAGTGYELDAIAAVVLGGTSLAGGQGGIVGTIIGALIIGILNNGLNLLNVSSFYQLVAKGAVILIAIFLDTRSQKRD
ncbi:ABC transporter permease [Orenia marismortui]|uniref:Ribose ABC transporter membrane protein n=1 Tax=Orenia marismortui TaxID=46469 RepID=A0A4R8H8K8_9FIRM|nr:ribose ABC transporter permease [Orenia marismortui]TDX51569.1 ribose ABC transporter membrane protein [Orenia marismortui]